MTTQAIQAAGVSGVRSGPYLRPRTAIEPSLLAMVRWVAVVVVLVLALCGTMAFASLGVATTPPAGPTQGLDL